MDFGTIGERLPFIIALVVFVILWQFFQSYLRRRRPEIGRREIARSLLSEVSLNQALAEIFNQQQKPRRFEMVSWQRSKSKLDFLDQPLQGTLAKAFGIVEDYNQQIEMAKKFKSYGTLESINIDKLKEPLADSRQGLEQWLHAHGGRREPPVKHPGFSDRLFGG